MLIEIIDKIHINYKRQNLKKKYKGKLFICQLKIQIYAFTKQTTKF